MTHALDADIVYAMTFVSKFKDGLFSDSVFFLVFNSQFQKQCNNRGLDGRVSLCRTDAEIFSAGSERYVAIKDRLWWLLVFSSCCEEDDFSFFGANAEPTLKGSLAGLVYCILPLACS